MDRYIFLLLYHNLGGEMIYILNQRLVAQKISQDKCHQVLTDVLLNFCTSTNYWMNTVLASLREQPDPDSVSNSRKWSSSTLKETFRSVISSSSIMRLTTSSYDKLFELMIGVLKFQVCRCPFPSSLYFVSLNHINSLIDLATDLGDGVKQRVKTCLQDSFVTTFSSLSKDQWSILRNHLLSNFLLDVHTRISLLLRQNQQDIETGLYDIPVQGEAVRITHYDNEGRVISEHGLYVESVAEITTLGLDIYCKELPSPSSSPGKRDSKKSFENQFEVSGDKESDLLKDLLGFKSHLPASTISLDFAFVSESDGDSHEHGRGNAADEKETVNGTTEIVTKRVIQPLMEFDDDYNFDAPAPRKRNSNEETLGDELLALMDS